MTIWEEEKKLPPELQIRWGDISKISFSSDCLYCKISFGKMFFVIIYCLIYYHYENFIENYLLEILPKCPFI